MACCAVLRERAHGFSKRPFQQVGSLQSTGTCSYMCVIGYKKHQQPIYHSKVSSMDKFHQLCKLLGIIPCNSLHIYGVLDYTLDGVAFFAIDLPAGASKTFYLTPREDPNNMAFPSPDGSLEYTRRFISMSEGDADLPNAVFMARTATTGGVPPATCPKGATQVDVPYTAVYTFYTCA